jgi:L-amino acid N-acyltransferase YncA
MRVREARIDDAGAIGRAVVDTWRAQYRGLVSDAFLDGMSVDPHTRRWARRLSDARGQQVVYVAESEGGQVIGFAGGGAVRDPDGLYPLYAAELHAIYVLPAYQGRGIGRRLIAVVARRLAEAGMRSLVAWVLAANPARRFYQALGGQIVHERSIDIGGEVYEAIAYGWPDTSALLLRA